MWQENLFFYQPVIFYGSHDESQESEEKFLESWDLQIEKNSLREPSVGLFFHWFTRIE